MEKILTIAIPAYNVENFLEETICSCICPKIMKDIEIIIINDGSQDRTEKIAQKFCDIYPDTIWLVNKENGGHGSAINCGINHATGKYFKLVDGDDWLTSDELEKFVDELKKINSDIVFTHFNMVDLTTKIKTACCNEDFEFQKEYKLHTVINKMDSIYEMHRMTLKTALLKKIKHIREHSYYVDMEYIIYPLKYAETIIFLDLNLYQYRIGNVGQSVSLSSLVKNREMHKIVIEDLICFQPETAKRLQIYEFINRKIATLTDLQIRIYLVCGKSAELECFHFLEWIELNSPHVLKYVCGTRAKLVIKSKGKLFRLIAKFTTNV